MIHDRLGPRAQELLRTAENQTEFLQYLQTIYTELNQTAQTQLTIELAKDSEVIENEIFEWLALRYSSFK